MSSPEQTSDNRPHDPAALPPELAAFLKDQDYACVTETTDQGTVFVIKFPTADIASVRRTVPILLRQTLYPHPAAPVIQMILRIFDRPKRPLALETFINVADDEQRARYAALTSQTELPMLFYYDALVHQFTKVISLPATTRVSRDPRAGQAPESCHSA